MRRRLFVVMSGLCSSLLVLGGIAAAESLGSEYGRSTPLLYLSSERGITALDATSGDRAFTVADSVASGDWQRLVSATPNSSSSTRLRTVDAYDGDTAGEAIL